MGRQTLAFDRWEWIVAFDGAQPELERELIDGADDAISLRTVTIEAAGPGPARDAAARSASFPVLYLSDDDCLPEPTVLERHLAAQREPAVYLGPVTFDDGVALRKSVPPRRPGWWNLGGANASMPADAFRRIGGFGTATIGYGGEDLWLGRRLARRGLAFRRIVEAEVRHLGPDPQVGGDTARAYRAGANAVRLAKRDRGVTWRLGVHPVLLTVKALWFALPVTGFEGKRLAYERAYAEGARSAWKESARDGADSTSSEKEHR